MKLLEKVINEHYKKILTVNNFVKIRIQTLILKVWASPHEKIYSKNIF